MKTNFTKKVFCGMALLVMSISSAKAQFTLTGQLRTRSELRAGQGTLQQKGDVPAFFTSQRTRLNFGYTGYRFKIFTAVQDVRVWGQDASQINRYTTEPLNGLMLHEAYGEILLNDTAPISKIENLSLKIGRQEIAYDDAKILGNLDWLQQARRHDAVVLKFSNKGWTADIGVAYNQNKELNTNNNYQGKAPWVATASSTSITPTSAYPPSTNGQNTMYKSFQYLYLGKKFFFGNASLLSFAEDFNKYNAVTKLPVRGVWSRYTNGAYINAVILKKLTVTGSAYYQTGKDKDGIKVESGLLSITAIMQVGRKLTMGGGMDYLSGNDGTKPAATATSSYSHRFDPLYGTPHKFWGFMDYFYVASPFGAQGLKNYFYKLKYKPKDNLTISLDVHAFAAANRISNGTGGTLDRYLGTEADLVINYSMTKIINFELGYSIMQATNAMASTAVKSVKNAELMPQWAYLMVAIKPNFMAK